MSEFRHTKTTQMTVAAKKDRLFAEINLFTLIGDVQGIESVLFSHFNNHEQNKQIKKTLKNIY